MESMQVDNVNDIVGNGKTSPTAKKRRPGKASRKRTSEAFRRRVGTKQNQELRDSIAKKYGLFDADAAELEKSLTNMSLTVQSYAVPLTVSTRGIGFAVAVEYSRMITTWNLPAITEICTIYQFYRVGLYLAYYRVCESRYSQSEVQSCSLRNMVCFSEEIRQILSTVSQVPIATSTILGAIGRVEGSTIWHSYLPDVELTDATSCAIFLSPKNIREIMSYVNADATPLAFRQEFRQLCSVPCMYWSAELRILNADDVWPADYGADQLRADVHAYTNLLTRVSGRLPRSFISGVPPGGVAAKSGLVSMDPIEMYVRSEFEPVIDARAGTRKRKGEDGRPIEVETTSHSAARYRGSTIYHSSMVVDVWSPDHDIGALELTVGAAVMVGECHGPSSTARLQINRKRGAHVSPGTVLMALVDAPRPRT